ncbi:MAG TPA: sensor histidine kinase [Beijerinckiaceae bacterium]
MARTAAGSTGRAKPVVARSIQWHLGVLCAVFILPVLGFVGWVLWEYTRTERLRLEQQRIETLDRVTTTVERDLSLLKAMAELAASSPLLAGRDAAAAEQPLRDLAAALGMPIILRSASGQPILTAGGAVSSGDLTEPEKQALLARRAVISATTDPSVLGGQVTVTAPVPRPGSDEPRYLLSFAIGPERIARAVNREEHSPGVSTTVLDASGGVIATARGQGAVNVPNLSPLALQMARPGSRTRATSPEGTPLLIEQVRLAGADWTVVAAVSEDALRAPFRRFLLQLAATGGALALLSYALAVTFGRRIVRALEQLSQAAGALGRDRRTVELATPITQINEVAGALQQAGRAIRQGEERQALLNRELHHRVKNTLTTVQAIANLAARSSGSVDELRRSLTSRIGSLAKTHDLLVGAGHAGAPLEALLRNELEAYEDQSNRHVALDGPPLEIPAEMALAMGMVVHELVTNAAKHGALAVPTGRLTVSWAVDEAPGGSVLSLDWREVGKAPEVPEGRQGFGTTLLDRLAQQLGGTIERDFAPDGVRVRLAAPIPEDLSASARTA